MNESDLGKFYANSLTNVVDTFKSIITGLIKDDHTRMKRVIYSKNNEGKLNNFFFTE
jgi:hypothetical protein